MLLFKANILHQRFLHLSIAIIIGLLNLSSVRAQEDPQYEDPTLYETPTSPEAPISPEGPPWASDDWQMTTYNTPILVDVLVNDFGMSNPIDSSTLTIVGGAQSGTAEVDPSTGMILYTPTQNFVGFDLFEYTVADTAGNISNVAYVSIWVENMPPSITFELHEDLDNSWVCYGTVWDEVPSTCTITFGGLLEGETASVASDGTFELNITLSNGEQGFVTAQATDEIGDTSDVLYNQIYHYE